MTDALSAALITDLAGMQEYAESRGVSGPKAAWVKLESGKSMKFRFAQELDVNSPNYDPEFGRGFIAPEHVKPADFRVKFVCTKKTEGKCYGCELAQRYPKKGFAAKGTLYINILDLSGEEPVVKVLAQKLSPKHAATAILEQAELDGQLTGTLFSLKRTGKSFNETGYTLTKGSAIEEPLPKVELYDLTKTAIREVAYADQEAHFGEIEVDETPASEAATGTDFNW